MEEPAAKKLRPAPCSVPVPEMAKPDLTVTDINEAQDMFTFMHLLREIAPIQRHKIKLAHGRKLLDRFYETMGDKFLDSPENLHLAIYALDRAFCSLVVPSTAKEERSKLWRECGLWYSGDIGKKKTEAKFAAFYKIYKKFQDFRNVEWMYDTKGKTVKEIVAGMKKKD
jgi:hypothetical protein